MPDWLLSEYGLWLAAAVAAALAALAARLDRPRAVRLCGWCALVAFGLGAAVWMFSDTYAHYFAQKEKFLRLAYWGSYREHEMWGEILAAFRKRYPDIPIRQEYITDDYENKIHRLLIANDAPDVILFQDEPLPQFALSGGFEPLDDWCRTEGLELNLDRDYWETSVESFRYKGKTYAIPVWGGDCLIIYSKKTFRDAGVPEPPQDWTLEEFLETCKRLTADTDGDGRIDRFAFRVPGWVYWLPFHYAFGATYLDPTRTKWTLWGEEAVASYRFWQDLLFRHHVSPHRDELLEGGNVPFMTGRLGMYVSGPWAMPTLNEADIPYDVAHMPRGPGGRGTRVTWDALAMCSGSKKKDWAWKLIHFAASREAQEIVARYQRSVPALKAAKDAFIRANPKVHAERFIEAFSYARIQPITRHWYLMSREVSNETDLLLDNRQTPGETIRRLATNRNLARCFEMPQVGQE